MKTCNKDHVEIAYGEYPYCPMCYLLKELQAYRNLEKAVIEWNQIRLESMAPAEHPAPEQPEKRIDPGVKVVI
jgi:hypothetical protein